MPKSFRDSVLVPVPKGNKDASNSSNYRPIALSSTFSKIIDNIDYVTGIGNCIKPEGTMRVVFSTSYLLPVKVRPYIQM